MTDTVGRSHRRGDAISPSPPRVTAPPCVCHLQSTQLRLRYLLLAGQSAWHQISRKSAATLKPSGFASSPKVEVLHHKTHPGEGGCCAQAIVAWKSLEIPHHDRLPCRNTCALDGALSCLWGAGCVPGFGHSGISSELARLAGFHSQLTVLLSFLLPSFSGNE